ncbi:hypothetical protein [Coxiella-like endosymbiont of Rhipicephalus sanguineus]|uniref:hypothetical protein n=1 Tax=Coxiella-like endosymbiont of Rhipicephalus sanguineus TaxID=1955402 RepID=UPI003557A93B
MESHKKLKNYKIAIKPLKTKSYCLAQPLILLDKQKIVSTLQIKSIPLELFEQVDSTNDYLKTASHHKLAICISEMQTKGKGRFYRPWHSPLDKIFIYP